MSSVFTKIYNNELEGEVVYEDKLCFAVLTIEPINDGHILLIPHQEASEFIDLDDELTKHLSLVTKKLSIQLKKIYKAKKIGVLIEGFGVEHVHIHIFPLYSPSDINIKTKQIDSKSVKLNAEKIRKEL